MDTWRLAVGTTLGFRHALGAVALLSLLGCQSIAPEADSLAGVYACDGGGQFLLSQKGTAYEITLRGMHFALTREMGSQGQEQLTCSMLTVGLGRELSVNMEGQPYLSGCVRRGGPALGGGTYAR